MRFGGEQRVWVREALLALLVVALTFLNFGHTSAVFAAGGRVVVTGHSICGDQQAPNDGEHFACHACRPVAIALPPPPVAVEPVCFTVVSVDYADVELPPLPLPRLIAARPRGPPFV